MNVGQKKINRVTIHNDCHCPAAEKKIKAQFELVCVGARTHRKIRRNPQYGIADTAARVS